MAAHRKSDQRRVCHCAGELRCDALETKNDCVTAILAGFLDDIQSHESTNMARMTDSTWSISV
jgi:hypothetical protein